MKRFILMLAMFSSLGVQAQIQKGTQLIGGNIQGSYSGYDHPSFKPWSLGLSPKYAYFLKDKFALGFRLGYDYAQNQTSNVLLNSPGGQYTALYNSYQIYREEARTNTIGAGIFVQNYFMLNAKFGFMLQSGINTNLSFQKNDYTNSISNGLYVLTGTTDTLSIQNTSTVGSYKHKSLAINIGVIPSIVYFPTPHIGLVATFGTFGLNHSMVLGQSFPLKRTTFDAGLMSMSLSFQYHFGKPKE